MLFAAPDFGAGGGVVLLLLIVLALVLGCALFWFIWGITLLRRPKLGIRLMGITLMTAGVLLPVGCCSAPSILFRMKHDNPPLERYPNGVVEKGMTQDQVRALLGDAHVINKRDGGETWLYYLDAIELGWFMVTFDVDGRVASTGGD